MRTRRAILDAVAELFGEGEAAPSADRIAERAQVARRTVFHHFPTIGVLFEAVREREIDVVTSLRTDVDHSGSVADRAGTIVARLDLAFAVASPVFVTAPPAQTAELAELLEYVQGILREATEAAVMRPGSETVDLDFPHWQAILELQSRLAELLRSIGDPG